MAMIRCPSVVRRCPPFSQIFYFETALSIKAKFYKKHLWEAGTNVFINNLGQITKMAAMPIYSKNPSNIFSGTTRPISTKLGMKHLGLQYYIVFINHDSVMTLTYFTARSRLPSMHWNGCKLFECHLKGITCRKWANGPTIYGSEKCWTPAVTLPPPRGNTYYKT